MPRLINLGVGEIVDRLTILSLKILYGAQAAKPIAHFEQERNALLVLLRGRELNGGWFEHTLALAAVNSTLWRSEDQIRALRPAGEPRPPWDPVVEAQQLAFRIQALNDARACLVETINKLTGDFLGSEKV